MGLYITTRILWIDLLRAIAILSMIVFHTLWDLNQFSVISINIFSPSMIIFRDVIIVIFLFLVGFSLDLSYQNFKYNKFIKRVILLGAVSVIISVGSYYIYPSHWIFFGIIHFILLSTFVGVIFVKRYKLSFVSAIVIFMLSYYDYGFTWLRDILTDYFNLPIISYDILSFTPWFGVVLSGIWFHSIIGRFDIVRFKYFNIVEYISKHSLIIYLIHQPILFGGFYIYKYLI